MLNKLAEKYRDKAELTLRIGLAAVFFYFGIKEVLDPVFGISYISPWVQDLIPISLNLFVIVLGIAHIVGATLLLVGLWTRWAALGAMLLLLGIIINLGFNDLAARDFAILVMAKSVFILGGGKYSVDKMLSRD